MCLITDQKRVKIATKDMVVYKVLTNNLYSYLFGFEYKLNTLYKTKLINTKEDACHDFEDQNKLTEVYGIDYGNQVKKGELKSIGPGFHSALNIERLDLGFNVPDAESLWKCIIPKGSRYYTNPSGLIVSNQIIVKEKIKSY